MRRQRGNSGGNGGGGFARRYASRINARTRIKAPSVLCHAKTSALAGPFAMNSAKANPRTTWVSTSATVIQWSATAVFEYRRIGTCGTASGTDAIASLLLTQPIRCTSDHFVPGTNGGGVSLL